jgi:ligand-binding sensor domain-containing protein/signal transduction histidine kinase
MMRWRRRLTVAIILFSLAPLARALDPNRSLSQYVHNVWRSDNGFLGGAVYAICQSQDGYLWFGTERGLVRFDGFDFRLIQRPILGYPPIGAVRGLVADTEGNLWIRPDGPRLIRYRNGFFEDAIARFGLSEAAFTAMSQDSTGELLLWGLHNRTLRFHQGHFDSVLSGETLIGVAISATQTSDGSVWLGTRDAGLLRIFQGHLLRVSQEPALASINALATANNAGLWIGTDSGLDFWDGKQNKHQSMLAGFGKIQVFALIRDRQGNLWAGTNHGLLRVTPSLAVSVDFRESTPGTDITAVYEDRDGDIWFGGTRGIERLRDGMFTQYSVAEGLPAENGGPVYVDEEGRTWFAPASGGLYWLKDGHKGQVTDAGLGDDIVYSISGGGGELWLGRQQGGLTELTKKGASFVARTYTRANGLAQNSVFTVHRNRDGSVWAGTVSAGVSVLRRGKFTNYSAANGLESNAIFSIVEGHDGTMWVASPSGLACFADGNWKNFDTTDGVPSSHIRSIFEDAEHILWIASTTGIAYFANGGIEVPHFLPEPLREEVLGITQDRSGNLWVVTSDHVLQVNRERLLTNSLRDTDVLSYGADDGLPAAEGVRRDRSVVIDPVGRIWLSLAHGLVVADPSQAQGYAAPEGVRIESVSAEGHMMNFSDNLKLGPGKQSIAFKYADTNLSVPERIRFRYRLDGSDQGWSNEVALRQVVYTNLGPGKYRFRIVASNGQGMWNGPETTVPFVIEPALWQTWYFRLACVVALALLIALIHRLRLTHLTEQLNRRFHDRLAERTRIAQDLHDTLLQGVLSASMQLDLAEDQVPVGSPAKPLLRRVLELMAQVTEEGRYALQGLRTDSNSVDLESALSRLAAELVADEKTVYRVMVQGIPRRLRPAVRDEVYRIGREAVVNAFVHAQANTVEVGIEYANRLLRVLVQDDGCGIDEVVLSEGREGHWGLIGMRERSEGIGAQLELRSRVGTGTQVELVVPGAIAFENGTNRSKAKWLQWLRRER